MTRIEKLFKAGVHFGHKTQYWSPKMAPFIWGKKDGIHLINVALTDNQITKAENMLEAIAEKGLPILWVGTKKVARNIVTKYALESESPFFSTRWVGGALTNFQEVKKAVKKMLINEEIYEKSKKSDSFSGASLTKKELSIILKKVERSKKVISGIEKLSFPVGALIVTDIQKDAVAVKEAYRMGIPIIGLVDTNANPEGINIIIPTNDDLSSAIDIISHSLCEAIKRGKATFLKNNEIQAEKERLEKEKLILEKKNKEVTSENISKEDKKIVEKTKEDKEVKVEETKKESKSIEKEQEEQSIKEEKKTKPLEKLEKETPKKKVSEKNYLKNKTVKTEQKKTVKKQAKKS